MRILYCSPAQAADVPLVALGSTWRYLDDGSDQGTAWLQPTFDDAAWKSGAAQLGYGDGDEATVVGFGPDPATKFVTTYFRHTFQVSGAGAHSQVKVQLLRDDGAVVYLNGIEIFRSNLPPGPVDAQTLAVTSVGGADESTLVAGTAAGGALLEGTNVLAVEVHQQAVGSSDVSFDLALAGSNDVTGITRGPYLQSGSPTGVVVRWRTAMATDSTVRWGTAANALDQLASLPAVTAEHEVALTGLSPATRYYYSVGSAAGPIAGGNADYFFDTAPPPSTRKNTRIWVLGDSGTADANARAVRDGYDAFAGARHTDLWLMLGDNAYPTGTDAQYQAAVFDMYPKWLRTSVLWPTLGNHDAFSAQSATLTGAYYDMFTLPRAGESGGQPSGTEAYYSFDYGNIHFVCLDSQDSDRSNGSPMLTWLAADLQETLADWVIAFWHHPPYTKGSHDSDFEADPRFRNMRENVLPILDTFGVDLVLTGHSHSYERSVLLDGHYGLSSTLVDAHILDSGDGWRDGSGVYRKATLGSAPHEGTVFAVAGSSGQVSGGPLDHPAMFVSLNRLGSLVLDVEGSVLDATFLTDVQEVVDRFTIVKADPGRPVLCSVAPRRGCRAASSAKIDVRSGKPRLAWQWTGTQRMTSAELGQPPTTTSYALCLYDQRGLVTGAAIPEGDSWKAMRTGFRYRDAKGSSTGTRRVVLSAAAKKPRMTVLAQGAALGRAPLPAILPLEVQLVNDETGVCWNATFTKAAKNTTGLLRAKVPGS